MNNFKILIIADLDHFERLNKVSNTRFHFLHHLKKMYPSQIKLIGSSSSDIFQRGMNVNLLLDKLRVQQEFIPQLLVHYVIGPGAGNLGEQILVNGLVDLQIPKCLWIEDIQYCAHYAHILIKPHKFESVILQYKNINIAKEYLKLIPTLKLVYLEQFIDPNIFKPYHTNFNQKSVDVLFYGYVDEVYPFRQRLHNLLKKLDNQICVKFIEHPGYHQLENKQSITGIELAKEISNAKLCICTSSRYDLFLKKYLETAFCQTMICGNIPTDYKQMLSPDLIVEITQNMSDIEIITVIKEALSDNVLLNSKTLQLSKKIIDKYSFDQGCQHFISLSFRLYLNIKFQL